MTPLAQVSATAGATAAGEGEHPVGRGVTRRVVGALLLVALLLVALSMTLIYVSLLRHGTGAGARVTSVAVLPFKPLVPQNRDEALEFGIADILIGRLATLQQRECAIPREGAPVRGPVHESRRSRA